ncbi:hypothetical protein GGU10DRAFT_232750, partial [Lentinula aff. detonsa]
YRTGARDYISFCLSHDLSIEPTPLTLSRYIAHTSQFIASAPKYLTGAQHFLKSIYPDFGSNRNSALVQATINGSRKLRADPVKRKLPIRPSHLLIFEQRYYGNPSYDNLLFLVIISCMFHGCHRSGELVVKGSRSTINYRKIIKRSSVHFQNGHA